MHRSKFVKAAALTMCLACSFPLSASDGLDIFAAAEKPVREYTSKPPALLPDAGPDRLDIFAVRPSPTVDELKALGEKRLEPNANRPLAVGMCCEGVIGNYDEAYRLSLKTGKPLKVLVDQPWDQIVKAGKSDDGCLKCRVDVGQDKRFPVKGVFTYKPNSGQLWSVDPLPQKSCCNTPDCPCPCKFGGPCNCQQKPQQTQQSPSFPQVMVPTYQPMFQPAFTPMPCSGGR